ncbi:MAG TPA: glucoamylase family protein [Puia sp.]|nr:glucoamylase family protein [Puia sp.]
MMFRNKAAAAQAAALVFFLLSGCKKNAGPARSPAVAFSFISATIDDSAYAGRTVYNTDSLPVVRIVFSAPVDTTTVPGNVSLSSPAGAVNVGIAYADNDSVLVVQPKTTLGHLTGYSLTVGSQVRSEADSSLKNPVQVNFVTSIDSSDKFPRISDSALLTLVEQQTFNYFWSGADQNSGMAKERTSQTQVTTGGSGFGVMSMLAAAERGFITRSQALGRISTIVDFLGGSATTFHGAFSHWINGSTGATIPFGTQDDGGDIVETSYLIAGLLCARQYFNSTTDPDEISLRSAINTIYSKVDWNWYRQNGQNVLYWNWSPTYNFAINVQVSGWSEALIAYVLAASAPTDSFAIPKIVYDNGWARNGAEKNGNAYYGITLPLGPAYGGPLFFAHYSFLGINPNGLSDAYANYRTQDTAHALINYTYCVRNPEGFNGYGSNCWGLTASDDNAGYSAHAPGNDDGVITPTAAISSLPYTPAESMNALRFFYYKLGDKIWGQYGFIDAFNLSKVWFDNDYLAIDQGPEVVMIENYRSGLLWNLFMSCPEIQKGMKNLGFSGPNLP